MTELLLFERRVQHGRFWFPTIQKSPQAEACATNYLSY